MSVKNPLVISSGLVEQIQTGDTLAPGGLTSTYIVYAGTSSELLSTNQIVIGATRPRCTYGLDCGFSESAGNFGASLIDTYIPRFGDLANIIVLDYQDEFAYLHTYGTITSTPAPNLGTLSSVLIDDATFVRWNSGTSPGTIVIEIIPTTPIPHRNNILFITGITFRSSTVAAIQCPLVVEVWDTSAGAYSTVYNGTISGLIHGYFQFLTPRWAALVGSSYGVPKLRFTFSPTNPLPGDFAIQRIQLYHTSYTWDPWHLHFGGGAMHGDITMDSGKAFIGDHKSSDGSAGATTTVAVAKVGGGTRTLTFKDGLYISYADT
jgi:hypothetical protein